MCVEVLKRQSGVGVGCNLPPGDTYQHLQTLLVITTVKDATAMLLNILQCTGTAPTTKKHWPQEVNSNTVEKRRARVTVGTEVRWPKVKLEMKKGANHKALHGPISGGWRALGPTGS